MKRWLFGLLCLALGLMLSSQAKAVSVAPNGMGDLLIFPAYYAAGMAKTKIIVVNTDATRSVVAKVVIRRASDSKETLDFFIYLSPNDYFEGEIYCTGPNDCYFTSSDESWLVGDCETPNPPYPLKNGENMGYVEIFEAFSANLGDHPSQQAICQAYSSWTPDGRDVTVNSLVGFAEIYWPGEELGYRAVAVKDYNLGTTVKATIAVDTQINSAVAQSLFNKANLVVPYDTADGVDSLVINSIARLVTGDKVCYRVEWFDTMENTCEPPRCQVSPCDPYHPECSCLKEVDFVPLQPHCPDEAPFTKGWAIVSLGLNGECNASAPVIPLLVRVKDGQMEVICPAFNAAAGGGEDEGEIVDCGTITDSNVCANTAGCGWAGGSINRCVSCAEVPVEYCTQVDGCELIDGECR